MVPVEPDDSEFVTIVYFHKNSSIKDGLIMRNEVKLKEWILEENISQYLQFKPEFFISFHNWIDSTNSFEKIHNFLLEQVNALKQMEKWRNQGDLIVTHIEERPSMIFFDVSPRIFKKVLHSKGIAFSVKEE
ncbi:MAG: hypothetical protein EAX86_11945 [Candidatus Heimdallarchaeota archaeon]|nr:hypothetical protein [Candidatus Heimdallarchaeota archaeon]